MVAKTFTKAMLVAPDGKVLVLRREPNDEHNAGGVDFPGGGVEPDEAYAVTIAREIKEETELVVAERDLRLVYTFTSAKETGAVLNRLLFAAHVATTDVRLSHEHDAYWWRTPDELRQSFPKGAWNDAIDFVLTHGLLN